MLGWHTVEMHRVSHWCAMFVIGRVSLEVVVLFHTSLLARNSLQLWVSVWFGTFFEAAFQRDATCCVVELFSITRWHFRTILPSTRDGLPEFQVEFSNHVTW